MYQALKIFKCFAVEQVSMKKNSKCAVLGGLVETDGVIAQTIEKNGDHEMVFF